MAYFSFLIYWEIKERKVFGEDIRLCLAVGVETSKPQNEELSLDLLEILDIKGIGILDCSRLFVCMRQE